MKKYLTAGLLATLLAFSSQTLADVAPTAGGVSVASAAATAVSASSARINGYLYATGGASSTTVGFSYGMTSSYGFTASAPALSAAGAFSVTLTGLACGTTYHYVANAYNSAGTSLGSDTSFTTPACPKTASSAPPKSASSPAVTTPAIAIAPWTGSYTFTKTFGTGATGADVAALQQFLASQGYFSVAPNGIYGPITTKSVTAFQNALSITPTTGGVGPRTLAALNAAIAGGGEPSGGGTAADASSGPATSLPAVLTLQAQSVTGTSAILLGSIGATDKADTVMPSFFYGTSLNYGMTAEAVPTSAGAAAVLSGLACGTTYHYELSAQNAAGTSTGGDMTFATGACVG